MKSDRKDKLNNIIYECLQSRPGITASHLASELLNGGTVRDIAHRTLRRHISNMQQALVGGTQIVQKEKKTGSFSWKEIVGLAQDRQEVLDNASGAQRKASLRLTSTKPLLVQPLSDLHLGGRGTDYNLFKKYTEYILKTDNLYIILAGDMTDNFIAFRNASAIHSQVLSPHLQMLAFQSWIEEIQHKVLFTTWGNHEEFEEKVSGFNHIKEILSHRTIYFDGMGLADLYLNDIHYRFAVTHKTRYWSSFNTTHGLKQEARKNIPDCDIYIAGDKHEPALELAMLRGEPRLFIQLGTLKVRDTYSERYFSYFTSPAMPCIELGHRVKEVTPFWTLEQAMKHSKY